MLSLVFVKKIDLRLVIVKMKDRTKRLMVCPTGTGGGNEEEGREDGEADG